MVAFKPCAPVRDDSVRDSVRQIKGPRSERTHVLPNCKRVFVSNVSASSADKKLVPIGVEEFFSKALRHCSSKCINIFPIHSSEIAGNRHDLLLIDDGPERVTCVSSESRVLVFPILLAGSSFNKFVSTPAM